MPLWQVKMKPKLNINESFICKIWEGGAEYYSGLVADNGEDIEIVDYGTRNYDSGPDYKNAKVKIGGKVYSGDVEIHRDFKNWAEHDHPKDRKYNSVVLHVVLWDSDINTPPKLRIKRELPTVILSNFLNQSIHDVWQDIISKPSDKFLLPCSDVSHLAPDDVVTNWFSKLSIERLKIKTERIKHRLEEISNKSESASAGPQKKSLWEQVLYEFVFEALGYSKNKEQMMRLAENLPLRKLRSILSGEEQDLIEVQSALFGSAGLLFDVRCKDGYIDKIKENWKDFEGRLSAQRQNRNDWNFFRLRPQNFPTIRIAYGSQFILELIKGELLKSIILIFGTDDFKIQGAVKRLSKLFYPVADEYWNTHYDFGKSSKAVSKLLGTQRISDIIINVIIPLVYLYSKIFKDQHIKENVLGLYRNLKINPENSILRVIEKQVLKNRNIEITTPEMEQAAIQLYNFYCTRGRCDECEIGKRVFKNTGYEYRLIYY